MVYCSQAQQMIPPAKANIIFPSQMDLKVNDAEVKHNFKGLKNKPGSTKPADITSLVRKFQGSLNTAQLTYALTKHRYAYAVHLVRYVSSVKLAERVKNGTVIPKHRVLDDMNKSNCDDDVSATSTRMSLKDPISTMRIKLPVRSSHCTHIQCFDGHMFLQLQEQAPQWNCPVCSKVVPLETLCIDKYFEDILDRTPEAIEKVDVEPNGNWTVIKEEEDSQSNDTSNKRRAPYDDDFDDNVVDLVEVEATTRKSINGESRASLATPGGVSAQSLVTNTPKVAPREPSIAQSATSAQRNGKRPQVTIDLTLDDEDEPRPAKRQNTNNGHEFATSHPITHSLPNRSNSHSYNTNPNTTFAANYQPPARFAINRAASNGSASHVYPSQGATPANSFAQTASYLPPARPHPPNGVFGQPSQIRPPAQRRSFATNDWNQDGYRLPGSRSGLSASPDLLRGSPPVDWQQNSDLDFSSPI